MTTLTDQYRLNARSDRIDLRDCPYEPPIVVTPFLITACYEARLGKAGTNTVLALLSVRYRV